jgi:hypothetical protein
MTIAACHLSHEGVVLGADSTSTTFVQGPTPQAQGAIHHFNFAQKVFQVGESGTLGIALWGLGTLGDISYRTLIAQFADEFQEVSECTMEEVAQKWADHFWCVYTNWLGVHRESLRELVSKPDRTSEESDFLFGQLQVLSGGFCIGGRCSADRAPAAYEITYSPIQEAPPVPLPLQTGAAKFWGCPNLIERLLCGVDSGIFHAILSSEKWTGNQDDLIGLIRPHILSQPLELPIREAIDWVHASIYATIKTMKFSHMAPVCGGPIEIGLITTDRPFRWVIHKKLDAAVAHDGFIHV